jgi:hypothetical protein
VITFDFQHYTIFKNFCKWRPWWLLTLGAKKCSYTTAYNNYSSFGIVSQVSHPHKLKEYYIKHLKLSGMANLHKKLYSFPCACMQHIQWAERYRSTHSLTWHWIHKPLAISNWKNHINHIIPTWCAACYTVISVLHISNINTLETIYCANFISTTKYGTLWGAVCLTVKRHLIYKTKYFQLWLIQNAEIHVDFCQTAYRFNLFHMNKYFN